MSFRVTAARQAYSITIAAQGSEHTLSFPNLTRTSPEIFSQVPPSLFHAVTWQAPEIGINSRPRSCSLLSSWTMLFARETKLGGIGWSFSSTAKAPCHFGHHPGITQARSIDFLQTRNRSPSQQWFRAFTTRDEERLYHRHVKCVAQFELTVCHIIYSICLKIRQSQIRNVIKSRRMCIMTHLASRHVLRHTYMNITGVKRRHRQIVDCTSDVTVWPFGKSSESNMPCL